MIYCTVAIGQRGGFCQKKNKELLSSSLQTWRWFESFRSIWNEYRSQVCRWTLYDCSVLAASLVISIVTH